MNYRESPWKNYKNLRTPRHSILIPVRHPLNLIDRNPECNDSLESAKRFYANGAFTTWEVNARNLVVEMKGIIKNQQDWALRDAIGMAYVPYNRVAFNNLPVGQRNPKYPNGAALFPSYNERNDPLGMLLGGDQLLPDGIRSNPEFAVAATEGDAYLTGINPGESYREVYYFSLVVAFGVDRRYFLDTSFGATGYIHRPWDDEDNQGCESGYDYAFFRNQQFEFYGRNDRLFTTEELMAQGGWPDWASDNGWHYNDWETGFPPQGCIIP